MEPLADDALRIIAHVADATAKRYAQFATRDDMYQEVFVYYADHQKKFEKWRIAGEKEQMFRLMRALFGAAKQYGEREKAARSGYDFDDIHWYDTTQLATLIPLALNSNWDGLTGEGEDSGQPRGKTVASEGGSLLAMVLDVRRVLAGNYTVQDFDPDTEAGAERLIWLSRRLGGAYPAAPGYEPGRRRAMNNETAIAVTAEAA